MSEQQSKPSGPETTDPSHIQITALSGGEWGWVVWFGGYEHPLDRDGKAPTLDAAIERIRETIAHAKA